MFGALIVELILLIAVAARLLQFRGAADRPPEWLAWTGSLLLGLVAAALPSAVLVCWWARSLLVRPERWLITAYRPPIDTPVELSLLLAFAIGIAVSGLTAAAAGFWLIRDRYPPSLPVLAGTAAALYTFQFVVWLPLGITPAEGILFLCAAAIPLSVAALMQAPFRRRGEEHFQRGREGAKAILQEL